MAIDWDAIDEEYEGTEAAKAPEDVPDGKYNVYVHAFKMKETKGDDPKPMICWDLVVINPTSPYAGRHIFKNQSITESSMPYVKADLLTVGYPGKIKALRDPEEREAFLDICLEVNKKTTKGKKGDFANVYFNKVLDISDEDLEEMKMNLKEAHGEEPEEGIDEVFPPEEEE